MLEKSASLLALSAASREFEVCAEFVVDVNEVLLCHFFAVGYSKKIVGIFLHHLAIVGQQGDS